MPGKISTSISAIFGRHPAPQEARYSQEAAREPRAGGMTPLQSGRPSVAIRLDEPALLRLRDAESAAERIRETVQAIAYELAVEQEAAPGSMPALTLPEAEQRIRRDAGVMAAILKSIGSEDASRLADKVTLEMPNLADRDPTQLWEFVNELLDSAGDFTISAKGNLSASVQMAEVSLDLVACLKRLPQEAGPPPKCEAHVCLLLAAAAKCHEAATKQQLPFWRWAEPPRWDFGGPRAKLDEHASAREALWCMRAARFSSECQAITCWHFDGHPLSHYARSHGLQGKKLAPVSVDPNDLTSAEIRRLDSARGVLHEYDVRPGLQEAARAAVKASLTGALGESGLRAAGPDVLHLAAQYLED